LVVVGVHIAPMLEIGKQALAQHIANDVSSSVFVGPIELFFAVLVKRLGIGDGYVHVFLDGLLHKSVLL
jgi:hypothetical protein